MRPASSGRWAWPDTRRITKCLTYLQHYAHTLHMPNVNIYLPDDLAESVTAAKDRLNVSAVCQKALREEIAV